ncbi:RNA 2',3'-cyclic phosphodiesterase [Streptomyces nitrosporeus]|uniref:RNA 2',3'-cyclic phosphodiesterase n=1 Tax=Streptomyces nitrosporeus TaxID=28894 RepID=A0A5J6FAJ7_9ACTN|nr:RNA 2',3'-cyclic phosphodiesterase [Streptomyces nitrosporeus]QEU73076.1 RNA 2',3'-cyclic phosphodiesterase [Streptomyces nitrosporeus]GGZ17483.1 RNA 2',3'-cyclic phosphodiesterase [Streptomyces nitrosporeus]
MSGPANSAGSPVDTPRAQRLFAAVLPPGAAADELAAAVAPLRRLPGAGELRWTGRAGWHFTSAFFGHVEEELLPGLYERLERAAHRTGRFELRLRGGGRFDGRALWAGAAGGLDTLRLLADRAGAAARRAGVPMEGHRSYVPHLTLARSRVPADLTPYTAALERFEGTPWEAGELALVRSNPPVSGVPGEQPRYEVVRGWPLGR